MPIPLIIQGILGLLAAAPQVEALVASSKDYVTALFKAGLITKALQDQTHSSVDAIVAMRTAGIIPAAWQVRPDPAV